MELLLPLDFLAMVYKLPTMGYERHVERSFFFPGFDSQVSPELEVASFHMIILVTLAACAQDLPGSFSVDI